MPGLDGGNAVAIGIPSAGKILTVGSAASK